MTKATDVAAAAAVVNPTTAALLADREVSKHISAPAPADDYNPLAVSAHSGPLDYYPTLPEETVAESDEGEKAGDTGTTEGATAAADGSAAS